MKRLRKTVIVVIVIMLLVAQSVIAVENTTAEVSEKAETPSLWAAWDVQMINTYGIGIEENYQGYEDSIKGSQFLSIEEGFENQFNVADELKISKDDIVTRGSVVEELFDIIQLSLKLDNTNDDALTYFVDNKLIKGRTKGNYELDKSCTNEEMLVFAKRVYDHITYSLDLDAKGAFWKVSDENNTVYLLGSIHVSDGSVFPMSKDILEAFVQSDELVVEANILSFSEDDIAYLQKIMMLEEDKTIDQVISKETYEKYTAVAESLGIVPEVYNKLKPWYAANLLQTTQMSKDSYDAKMGIDVYFLSLATGNIPIVELEGAKYQFDMFDSFSPELQEGYLLSALEYSNETDDMIGDMLNSWKTGDVDKLGDIFNSESELESEVEKEFNDKLLNIRNANMSEKVKKMLTEEGEKDYFVVVGAGHMINDSGIVKTLRDLGYEVEQIK